MATLAPDKKKKKTQQKDSSAQRRPRYEFNPEVARARGIDVETDPSLLANLPSVPSASAVDQRDEPQAGLASQSTGSDDVGLAEQEQEPAPQQDEAIEPHVEASAESTATSDPINAVAETTAAAQDEQEASLESRAPTADVEAASAPPAIITPSAPVVDGMSSTRVPGSVASAPVAIATPSSVAELASSPASLATASMGSRESLAPPAEEQTASVSGSREQITTSISALEQEHDTSHLLGDASACVDHLVTLESHAPITYKTLPAMTAEDEDVIFPNTLLGAYREFKEEFLGSGGKPSSHPLYILIDSFRQARLSVAETTSTIEDMTSSINETENIAWTLTRVPKKVNARCGDGRTLSKTVEETEASLNKEVEDVLRQRMGQRNDLYFGDLVGHVFDAQTLRLRAQDYIDRVLHNSELLLARTEARAQPTFEARRESQNHTQEAAELRGCLDVLFYFIRQAAANGSKGSSQGVDLAFQSEIITWSKQLLSALLGIATFRDHWFVMNHILRLPRQFGQRFASFVQLPTTNTWTPEVRDHVRTVVHAFCEPAEPFPTDTPLSRHASSQPSSAGNSSSTDRAVVVDDSGEIISESHFNRVLDDDDCRALWDQLPIATLLYYVFAKSADGPFVDVQTGCLVPHEQIGTVPHPEALHDLNALSTNLLRQSPGSGAAYLRLLSHASLLRILAFAKQNLRILSQVFNDTERRRSADFVKLVGRQAREICTVIADYWMVHCKACRAGVIDANDPPALDLLQANVDDLIMQAFVMLLEATSLGVWTFTQSLPFHAVSLAAMWRMLIYLYTEGGFQPSDTPEADWKQLIHSHDTVDGFAQRIKTMSDLHAGTRPPLINMCAMANARNAFESSDSDSEMAFISAILNEVFRFSFVHPMTRTLPNSGSEGRELIRSLALTSNWVVSMAIGLLSDTTLDMTFDVAKYVVHGLPLKHWVPTLEDLRILGEWILLDLSNPKHLLARIFVEGINNELDDNRTPKVPVVLQREVAVALAEAAVKAIPFSETGAAISLNAVKKQFLDWTWEQVLRLRLRGGQSDYFTLDHKRVAALVTRADHPLVAYVMLNVSWLGRDRDAFRQQGLQLVGRLLSCQFPMPALRVIYDVLPYFAEAGDMRLTASTEFADIIAHFLQQTPKAVFASFFDNIARQVFGAADNSDAVLEHTIRMQLTQATSPDVVLHVGNQQIRLAQMWLQALLHKDNWPGKPSILRLIDAVISVVMCKPGAHAMILGELRRAQQRLADLSEPKGLFEAVKAISTGRPCISAKGTVQVSGSNLAHPFLTFHLLCLDSAQEAERMGEAAVHIIQARPKDAIKVLAKHVDNVDNITLFQWSRFIRQLTFDHPLLDVALQCFFSLYFATKDIRTGNRPARYCYGQRIFLATPARSKKLHAHIDQLQSQLAHSLRRHRSHTAGSSAQANGDESDSSNLTRSASERHKLRHASSQPGDASARPQVHEAESLTQDAKLARKRLLTACSKWLADRQQARKLHSEYEFVIPSSLTLDALPDRLKDVVERNPFDASTAQGVLWLNDTCAWLSVFLSLAMEDTHTPFIPSARHRAVSTITRPRFTSADHLERLGSSALDEQRRAQEELSEASQLLEQVVAHARGLKPVLELFNQDQTTPESKLARIDDDIRCVAQAADDLDGKLTTSVTLQADILEALESLYENTTTTLVESSTCNKGAACAGPAQFNFSYKKAVRSPAAAANLGQLRAKLDGVYKGAVIPSNLCQATIRLRGALQELLDAYRKDKPCPVALVDVATLVLRQIVARYSDGVTLFLPLQSLLDEIVSQLCATFVEGRPELLRFIKELMTLNARLAPRLSTFFKPACASASTYIDLYGDIATESLRREHASIGMLLLRRFEVDSWAKSADIKHNDRLRLLTSMLDSASACFGDRAYVGPESIAEHCAEPVLLMQEHFRQLLAYQFPMYVMQALISVLDLAERATVAPHFLQSLNQMISQHSGRELQPDTASLILNGLTDRLESQREHQFVYDSLAPYISDVAQLLKSLTLASIAPKDVNTTLAFERVTTSFHSLIEPSGTLSVPQPIESNKSSHSSAAHEVLQALLSCLRQAIPTVPLRLSLTWSYYASKLAPLLDPCMLDVVHSVLTTMEWQAFAPTAEEINHSLALLNHREHELVAPFIASVMCRVDWDRYAIQLRVGDAERLNSENLSAMLALMLQLLHNPSLLAIVNLAGAVKAQTLLPWFVLSHDDMAHHCGWLQNRFPSDSLFEPESAASLSILLLRAAAGLVDGQGEEPRQSDPRKRVKYVELVSSKLAESGGLTSHERLHVVVTTVLKDALSLLPMDKELCVQAVSYPLRLINALAREPVRITAIVQAVRETMDAMPEAVEVVCQSATESLYQPDHVVSVVEQCIESYFLNPARRLGHGSNMSWLAIANAASFSTMYADQDFFSPCTHNFKLLAMVALVVRRLHECPEPETRQRAMDYAHVLCETSAQLEAQAANTAVGMGHVHGAKLVVLWLKALELVGQTWAMGAPVEFVSTKLNTLFKVTFAVAEEPPSGLRSVISSGPKHKEVWAPVRMAARTISTFISVLLNNNGSLYVGNATRGRPGTYTKRAEDLLKEMQLNKFPKQDDAVREQVPALIAFIRQEDNDLGFVQVLTSEIGHRLFAAVPWLNVSLS